MLILFPFLTRRLGLLFAAALVCASSHAQIRMLPSDEIYIFAGTQHHLPITLKNEGTKSEDTGLKCRLFQASSSTLAPASAPQNIPSFSIPAGTVSTIHVPFDLPETRSITTFHLKVYQSEQDLGSLIIRACPTNLLSGLKSLASEIVLFDPANSWKQLFVANGITVSDLTPAPVTDSKAKVLLANFTSKQAEEEFQKLQDGSSPQWPSIFIVSTGVTSSEKLVPLKTVSGRKAIVVQDWFLPSPATNALAQLRLLRAFELLLKPELVKTPAMPQSK